MSLSSPSLITPNSRTILEKRYLDGESIDSMWDRVSDGNPRFRNLLSSLRFLPNSPTLFNAGRKNGCTLSACFVFCVDDEMGPLSTDSPNSIVNTRAKAIGVAKAGGGVGYYFGNLRPKGSPIKSIHRKACGPVTVLKDYQSISHLITQGGKRELAQMGVLNCEHPDIQEFIHVKDSDPQGLGSFNISVGWSNNWLDEVWGNLPSKVATELWEEQCESAWKSGCPGMLFPDVINRFNPNPHLGLIKATNPCGETPNRNDEPCNLGSLSLPRYFLPGNRSVDWKLLEEDIWIATEFLDEILDRNVFPHPNITEAALLTRKLGLGVMGWADLLAMMHIPYDSEEALELGEKIMTLIEDVSHACSEKMSRDKGPYKGYSTTKTQAPMRRNETNTSIAPTGTIALIAGVWGSIEPHFALGDRFNEGMERTTGEGIKMSDGVQNWVYEKLDGFRPKVASEIDPTWHVRHQATFQKHTDLGVSKTVNLPNSATVKDVSDTYKLMYDLECKGGTIFRDGCRAEQVLVKQDTKSVFLLNGLKEHVEELKSITSGPKVLLPIKTERIHKHRLPDDRDAKTHKFVVGDKEGFITMGFYEDGALGEIFLRMSKMGSTLTGLLDAWAISFSVALQHGTSLSDLCKHHEGTRFEPNGRTGNDQIPMCTSIPDYVCRYLRKRFLGIGNGLVNYNYETVSSSPVIVPPSSPLTITALEKEMYGVKVEGDSSGSGMFCPDCGNEVIYSSGCLTCVKEGCGWTRCG